MFRSAIIVPIMLAATVMAAAGEASAHAEIATPTAETVLGTLRPGHPRLLLSEARLAELKQLALSDKVLATCIADVLGDADRLVHAPALARKLIGPRLLAVSRECLRRTLTLGLAWRLTGKSDYAVAAQGNLLTVCAFSDWNPSHFLDVAEMSNAVGIGFDWLYAALSPEARATIRTGLVTHGLEEGVKAEGGWDGSGKKAAWVGADYNWNQVCHGGLTVAALALADSDAKYARCLVVNACRQLPKALASYDPDGAWPEGPGYWAYATDYTVYALAAMESALGTDFGLGSRPGLSRAGMFPLCARSPQGLLPNFADVGDRSRFIGNPALFWLGSHYQQRGISDAEALLLAGNKRASPLDVVWYTPASGGTPALPLDQKFGGPVELAVFRSAWGDANAWYAYVKAGYNQVNHGHLDLGSFEFDCMGARWARDLGSDDYNLPGYWNHEPGGARWRYYRLNSHSHSVPLIDGRDQLAAGTAKLIGFRTGDRPSAVIDLGPAYRDAAVSVRRGVALIDHRSALLIQDEFELRKPAAITWAMTTDATIDCSGSTATLTIDGKEVVATLLAPKGAVFTQESAEQQPPQKENKGVRRLLVSVAPQPITVRIAVRFTPRGATVAISDLKDLSDW